MQDACGLKETAAAATPMIIKGEKICLEIYVKNCFASRFLR